MITSNEKKKTDFIFRCCLFRSRCYLSANGQNDILFDLLPPLINKNMVYQTATLALTLSFYFPPHLKKRVYGAFSEKEISPSHPARTWIGIKPESRKLGALDEISPLLFTAVTAIIIFFQVIRQERTPLDKRLKI